MKKIILGILMTVVLAAVCFAPTFALAGGKVDVDLPNASAGSEETILKNVLNTVYAVSGVVAVIFIIIGGVTFATSAGNPNSVAKAKNTILFAVVGLIIVIAAAAITNFIIGAI